MSNYFSNMYNETRHISKEVGDTLTSSNLESSNIIEFGLKRVEEITEE